MERDSWKCPVGVGTDCWITKGPFMCDIYDGSSFRYLPAEIEDSGTYVNATRIVRPMLEPTDRELVCNYCGRLHETSFPNYYGLVARSEWWSHGATCGRGDL